MEHRADAPPELQPFEGDLEAPFAATERELLEDLYAVIDAVNLKPVRLTKSGIPPKPLWTAINQRLIWKDPASVLYDWEEVDQVRFSYLLALGLDLIRPDAELWLETGPGADAFFTASPLERARMVRRAYLAVLDWDERCDARDQAGGRYNFGKAYRRDFVHDIVALREHLLALLELLPGQRWVRLYDLALRLSHQVPDLLLSEVCAPPEVDDDGLDPEKLRLVIYALTLIGRFGWVEMGRVSGEPDVHGRLCRLTALGAALVHGSAFAEAPTSQLELAPDGRVVFAERPTASARHVARTLGRVVSGGRSRRPSYQIDATTLRAAVDQGADVLRLRHWLRAHTEALPGTVAVWLDETEAVAASVRIVQNVVGVELDPGDAEGARALEAAGFPPVAQLALADTLRTPALLEAVGGEPWDGFDYPPDEPLGFWKSGPVFYLFFDALPLHHRELVQALDPAGDPLALRFTTEKWSRLAAAGWTPDSVVRALSGLAEKPPSAKVLAQLQELANEAPPREPRS